MRTKASIVALALLGGASAGLAQDAAPLDGQWIGRFRSVGGVAVESELQVANGSGNWRVFARVPTNPCIGLPLPLTVADATPEGATLVVQGSKALTGCSDFELKLVRRSATEYASALPDGRPIVFVRR